jgi:hypothetical protein
MEKLNIFTLTGSNRIPIWEVYGLAPNTNLTFENYNINVLLTLFPEFKDIFDDNVNNRYNIIFSLYLDMAKHIFTDWEYGDLLFYCVSLYIAHNLQLTLGRTKNYNNVANLNAETPASNNARNIGSKSKESAMSDFQREYSKTSYGQALYPIMRQIGLNRVRGVY